uniref:Uncharacterized protein n=1 Tax=Aegilops tauschii subsp. strangulata TaxID=200361 RepID=A0A453R5G4_AEGTS
MQFQKEIVDHELTYQMEERWANIWKCRSKNLGLQDATIGVASKAKTITHKKYEILKQGIDSTPKNYLFFKIFLSRIKLIVNISGPHSFYLIMLWKGESMSLFISWIRLLE